MNLIPSEPLTWTSYGWEWIWLRLRPTTWQKARSPGSSDQDKAISPGKAEPSIARKAASADGSRPSPFLLSRAEAIRATARIRTPTCGARPQALVGRPRPAEEDRDRAARPDHHRTGCACRRVNRQ